ncbi:MAG: deoxyribonuclease V [Spirochaetes bacterium]|nr:MAG: deoxyribonuclease V [Spirochaetota bacterium]
MKIKRLHDWNLSLEDARSIQNELSSMVIKENSFDRIKTVAGMDIGFHGKVARASCVVLTYPECKVIEKRIYEGSVNFPYIPGYLSFREIPILASVLEMIENEPDLLIADGQGVAHPRRLGLAAHIGLLTDKPTIGCAKSLLVGKCEEPENRKGAYSYLVDKGEIIGACLRTRVGVKPVYVSIGHRISLESSIEYVLGCCNKYRLPEPTREAHRLASG